MPRLNLTMETETLNVSTRINWFPYNPDYVVGYLPGESGYNYSYSIHSDQEGGNRIYRLFGPKFNHLIDCPSLESAKLFAERMEAKNE